MDDIDRDIERGKIGKSEEELFGWDHIRPPKQPVIDLPPMPVKPKPSRKKKGHSNENSGFILFVMGLLIVAIMVTKLIGLW
jgi:hypothetical protein